MPPPRTPEFVLGLVLLITFAAPMVAFWAGFGVWLATGSAVAGFVGLISLVVAIACFKLLASLSEGV